MSDALPKEARTLLEKASEMFDETGCVPGFDGEEVPAETIVPDAKEYILETIDDPEVFYDPEIWAASGFTLVLSWLAQKWLQKCRKLAPRGNKNPVPYLEPISKSFEEHNEAGKLDKAEEIVGVVLPTNEDPALPLKPGEEALDEPASHVAA